MASDRRVFRRALAVALALAAIAPQLTGFADAGPIAAREGWAIAESSKPYATLLEDLKAAVVAEKMGVLAEAGPTEAARARGVDIPGNRVVGVFRNDFAVRALEASTAAMVEGPIRFYVTEAPDGTAWLPYKRPSFVFAPYAEEDRGEKPDLGIIFGPHILGPLLGLAALAALPVLIGKVRKRRV